MRDPIPELEDQIDRLELAETELSRLVARVNGTALPDVIAALDRVRKAISIVEGLTERVQRVRP